MISVFFSEVEGADPEAAGGSEEGSQSCWGSATETRYFTRDPRQAPLDQGRWAVSGAVGLYLGCVLITSLLGFSFDGPWSTRPGLL